MSSKKGAVNEHVADYDIKHNKEGVKSGDTRQVGAELMKQSPSPRVPIAPRGPRALRAFSPSPVRTGVLYGRCDMY